MSRCRIFPNMPNSLNLKKMIDKKLENRFREFYINKKKEQSEISMY